MWYCFLRHIPCPTMLSIIFSSSYIYCTIVRKIRDVICEVERASCQHLVFFSQQNVIKLCFFLHMLSTGKLKGLICLKPFRCATWLRKSLTTWHVLAFTFLVQDNDKRAVFEKFYANKFGCQIFQRKSSCSAIGTEQDGGDEDGDQDDEQVKSGDKILRKYHYNIRALCTMRQGHHSEVQLWLMKSSTG